MHRDFWSNLTLEKPTRGKPVREGIFIISELRENFFYSRNIINKTSQTYLKSVPRFFLENSANLLEKRAQKNMNSTTLIFCAFSCMDGMEITSENCAQQSPRFLCKEIYYGSLGMCAKLLKNLSSSLPRFLCIQTVVRPLEIRIVRPLKSVVLLPRFAC
jgi:hypothetical protein